MRGQRYSFYLPQLRSPHRGRRGMDYYHGWFDLKPGIRDSDFARGLALYMAYLQERGLIEGWKLARRKLGFGPSEIGEFHLVIETKNLAQLDEAFNHVATRSEPV